MFEELPTPFILIDADVARANLARMAAYAADHHLKLRPHAKTHKSRYLGRLQMELGAAGLTVAKPGEAAVMAEVSDDILMAYPAIQPHAAARLAEMARMKTVRVGLDSTFAADRISAAAVAAGSVVGLLVDLDVGHHRTGVQTPAEAVALAQYIDRCKGVRLDGVMCFPGHIAAPPAAQEPALRLVREKLEAILSAWERSGLRAAIVSGGSTPTAYQSHLIPQLTEIRPGTYIFNDMNCVRGGCATLDQCAARIIATVISAAVPGQIVLDAGSKTLTSDRCGPAPESGHGHIVEFPAAKIVKLSEEHAQVDVAACDLIPRVGQRVSVIPNHICPCVNLQDNVWWKEPDASPRALPVDARGKVF